MSWGYGRWNLEEWGGNAVPIASVPVDLAVTNARPYPPDTVEITALVGGSLSVELPSTFLDLALLYNNFIYLDLSQPELRSRRILSYDSGRVCVFDHAFQVPIPAAGEGLLIAPDNWPTDRLCLGIRPTQTMRLDVSSLRVHLCRGNLGFEGLIPELSIGNPLYVHEGYLLAGSSGDQVLLDNTQLTAYPAAWVDQDSFRGMGIRLLQGPESGQVRRIVRNDAGGVGFLGTDFDGLNLDGLRYELITIPEVELGSPDGASAVAPTVDASLAGVSIAKAGVATQSVFVMPNPISSEYKFQSPVVFRSQFKALTLTNAAEFASIACGYYLHGGIRRFGIGFELHDDGADAKLKVYNQTGLAFTQTFVGYTLVGKVISLESTYYPDTDTMKISVLQDHPFPGSFLLQDYVVSPVIGGGFTGPVFGLRTTPAYSFFGVMGSDATAEVQFLSSHLLYESIALIKNGIVQGLAEGEILPSTPASPDRPRDPVYWNKAWRPRTRAGRDTPAVEVVNNLSRGFQLHREEKVAAPMMYVREEPLMLRPDTAGFFMRLHIKTDLTDAGGIHTGVAMGAVFGQGTDLAYCYLTFLEDLQRFIALHLINQGDLTSDYLRIGVDQGSVTAGQQAIDWSGQEIQLNLIYAPYAGPDTGVFAVVPGGFEETLLLKSGVDVSTLFPGTSPSVPLDRPGIFFGLTDRESSVSIEVTHVDYFIGLRAYIPTVVEKLPDALTTDPWIAAGPDPSSLVKKEDYLRVELTGHRYYYKTLDAISHGPHGWIRPDDGFIVEFRFQGISALHSTFGEYGIWSGNAVAIDDESDRLYVAFADAGALGKIVYVPQVDIGEDAFEEAFIQTYLERICQNPEKYAGRFHLLDWTQEHYYRVERSPVSTSYRQTRVRVYVDNMVEPVIDVQYESGRYGDSSADLGGFPSVGGAVAWGNLLSTVQTVSQWGEIYYGTSTGFDLHVDRKMTEGEHELEMVTQAKPSFTSFVLEVDEA